MTSRAISGGQTAAQVQAALVPYQPKGDTQVVVPTTGQTVTANAGVTLLVVNPAGSLLALTVTFPAAPADKDVFALSFMQAITTLVLDGGTILGTLTSAILGQGAQWKYVTSLTRWVAC